jgi:hypothetical protein
MRDRPSGDMLAALADELGGTDALALRCRAIAEREAAQGEGAFAACRAALIERYGAGDDGALLRSLAGDIRAGALDEASAARTALAKVLLAITRQKLRASNPDYLAPITPR